MLKINSDNIHRLLKNDPSILTRNSYLNFLRFYCSQHPRYSWRKILKTGFIIWNKLTLSERKLFIQKVKKLLWEKLHTSNLNNSLLFFQAAFVGRSIEAAFKTFLQTSSMDPSPNTPFYYASILHKTLLES